jgi:hypothetical protein
MFLPPPELQSLYRKYTAERSGYGREAGKKWHRNGTETR